MRSSITPGSRHPHTSVLALLVVAGLAAPTMAQFQANINGDLRPLVDVQFPNATAAAARPFHFLGLFDTGSPNTFVAPQVNSLLTLASVPAGGVGQPALPDVSLDFDFAVGGFLGRRLAGPQVNNAANVTHQFTSSTAGLGANTATRGLRASLTNFTNAAGNNFNMINIGQNFVMNNPGAPPTGGLVALVDPIHAFAAPINFTASDPGAAGITVDNSTTSWRSSSVGFLTLGTLTQPTPAINENPGFLSVLSFVAPGAGGYVNSQPPGGRGPHNAADPGLVLSAAERAFINQVLGRGGPGQPAAFNPAATTNIIPDTGAPTSSAVMPGAGGEVLLGTDFFNRFTQYWNYNGAAPNIMLFGPTRQGDRDLVGQGLLMTVQRGASGGFLTGVQQMRQAGPPASTRVNDTISPAADDLADQAGVGIYRSHASASNAVYISGREAMGLQAGANGDQIDGMKLGADLIAPSVSIVLLQPDRFNSMVHFSVSADSQGLAEGNGNQTIGGGVRSQFDRGQVAGDIFYSTTARPRNRINQNTPENGTNNLRFNQDVLGLQGNAGPLVNAAGRGTHDNLRDFDLRPDVGMVDSSQALRNLDPTIRQVGDSRNPMGAAETGALPARSDRFQTNFYTYYSLERTGPTVVGQGASGASIYTTSAAGNPTVWSTPALMGLLATDDIDAFSLQRIFDVGFGLTPSTVSPVPGLVATQGGLLIDNRFDPNPDERFGRIDFTFNNDLIVFSLAPGSPTLNLMSGFLQRTLSAADLFISDFDGSFALWASAESLGLRPQDDIDGLDITAIPAPGVLPLLGLAGLVATRRRRR